MDWEIRNAEGTFRAEKEITRGLVLLVHINVVSVIVWTFICVILKITEFTPEGGPYGQLGIVYLHLSILDLRICAWNSTRNGSKTKYWRIRAPPE
jgi:hypothetical protein